MFNLEFTIFLTWLFENFDLCLWGLNVSQIGSAVGGTTSAFYGFNHGMRVGFFFFFFD